MVEHGALDEASRPCGVPLSLPHAHALLELQAHQAPMSVSELATRLRIDRTNVSRLCQRMEEQGELLRGMDREDGRVRTLRLTAQGEEAAARVDLSEERVEQILAGMRFLQTSFFRT
jgi:DNA-binding MarR family transcriptional regulator